MTSRTAKAKGCAEKQRLLEILLEATRVLAALESGKTQTWKIGISTARQNWRVANTAYVNHIRKHGCVFA